MTWGTTDGFLVHFGLSSLADLPAMDELKATGLLDTRPASAVIGAAETLGNGVVTLPFDTAAGLDDAPEFAPAAAAE